MPRTSSQTPSENNRFVSRPIDRANARQSVSPKPRSSVSPKPRSSASQRSRSSSRRSSTRRSKKPQTALDETSNSKTGEEKDTSARLLRRGSRKLIHYVSYYHQIAKRILRMSGVAETTEITDTDKHNAESMNKHNSESTNKGNLNATSSTLHIPASDKKSIALLLVLYIIQGVPMGLSGTLQLILSGKISYKAQSLLSLIYIPFSMKILWTPLVDSLYFKAVGRRKSWLIPVQTLCGAIMLWAGLTGIVDEWLSPASADGEATAPHVVHIAAYFCTLYFLMATQDICVDGWALTMLSHANRGYASTCNIIGQTIGFFLSNIGFMIFNNAHFCNTYIRITPKPYPIATMTSFLYFWGIFILVTTLFIVLFQKEKDAEIPTQQTSDLSTALSYTFRTESLSQEFNNSVKSASKSSNEAYETNASNASKDSRDFKKSKDSNASKDSIDSSDNYGCENRYVITHRPQHLESYDMVNSLMDFPAATERSAMIAEGNPLLAEDDETELTAMETYKVFFDMVKKPSLQLLIFVLLTVKVGTAAIDAASMLMLAEMGYPKEQISFIGPVLIPFSVVTSFCFGRYSTKLRKGHMLLMRTGLLLRLCCALVCMYLLYQAELVARGATRDAEGAIQWPMWVHVGVIAVSLTYSFAGDIMSSGYTVFFAKIADPRVGGTYMTFLNTMANIGGNWPRTVVLYLVDNSNVFFSKKTNSYFFETSNYLKDFKEHQIENVSYVLHGFYVLAFLSTCIGFLWALLITPVMMKIENTPSSQWLVVPARRISQKKTN